MSAIDSVMPPGAFCAAFPWWGGDLQTLRNKFIRPSLQLPGRSERLLLTMKDGSGDRLSAVLNHPEPTASRPLIVLIHGLTGDEDSDYVVRSAAFYLKRNHPVLRLNLRGAGPSRATCGGHYHSGCAKDLRDALLALDENLVANGICLVGYSLGGNILINFLARRELDLDVRGAVAVSPAIQAAAATKRIMEPRNALYHRWLLRQMKRECLAPGAELDVIERQAILCARTIYEFDDTFTAPRNGFKDADDYYARTAGWMVAPKIGVPTLLIHARNDPWIPVTPFDDLHRQNLEKLTVVISHSGGHVGFHAQGSQETWHDRCAEVFLSTL